MEDEQPLPEPATASVAMAAEEPSLFQSMDAPEDEAPLIEETAELRDEDDDGLPPPAYQPEMPAFEPQQQSLEAEPESFVAPRAPAPGTPSQETLVRLQRAVQNAPATPQRGTAAAADKPRFSVNSLINRMTGHAGDTPAERSAQTLRQQPPMRQADVAEPLPAEPEEDNDRIEIPAFLRRQAN